MLRLELTNVRNSEEDAKDELMEARALEVAAKGELRVLRKFEVLVFLTTTDKSTSVQIPL
jgi:hypothetical protein